MLVVYYLNNIRLMYYSGILLFVAMLFAYRYVGWFLSMQSEVYQEYGMGLYYAGGTSLPYLSILMILSLYLLGLLGISKDRNIYSHRLLYGGSIFTLIFVVLVRLDPNLIRITAYFAPWMGLMLPYTLKLWKPKKYKVYLTLVILVFIVKAMVSPDNYQFMWQEMQLHERYFR